MNFENWFTFARVIYMYERSMVFRAQQHIACLARYILSPGVRLFVTRVNQSKTVEVTIMRFPHPTSFCGTNFTKNF